MNLLEQRRLDLRMTIDELAMRSGVKERTIRNLEAGNVQRPHFSTVVPLAETLKLQPSELAQSFREPQAA